MPIEVTHIYGTTTQNAVSFNWTNPTNPEFSHVRILRNGVQVANNITNETFSDVGLSSNTQYLYTIKSVDASTEESDGLVRAFKTTGNSSNMVLEDFLDNTYVFPMTAGTNTWTRLNTNAPNGNAGHMASATISHNQTSNVTFTVNVPAGATNAYLEIDWAVSSESNFDFFRILHGGTTVFSQSGVQQGTHTRSNLSVGNHTILFRYEKDESVSSGADKAYVSDMRLYYTTAGTPDTTSPAEVTGLTGTPSTNSITLDWTNPTDIDFNYVRILRDSVEVAEWVANETFTVTGLTPDTQYGFTLITVDTAGNESTGIIQNYTTASDTPITGLATIKTSLGESVTVYDITGNENQALRIMTDSGLGYIPLVLTTDPSASMARIQTPQGMRALALAGSEPEPPSGTEVTNLSSSSIFSDSVTLSWTAVAGATSYDIERNGIYYASTTSTSITINGLTASTLYTFVVKNRVGTTISNGASIDVTTASSGSSGNPSGETETMKIWVGAMESEGTGGGDTGGGDTGGGDTGGGGTGGLEDVTNLSTSNIFSDSITLTWTSVNDATSYDVEKNGIYYSNTTSNSIVINGLSASTQYTFIVKARNSSEISDGVSIQATTASSGTSGNPSGETESMKIWVGAMENL